jgi:hypothetical protein
MAFIANSPAIDPFTCLRCGYEFDRAGGIGRDPQPTPSAGAVSLCIKCGDVAIFLEGGGLRVPTAAEMASIESDDDMKKIRGLLAQAIAARRQ